MIIGATQIEVSVSDFALSSSASPASASAR